MAALDCAFYSITMGAPNSLLAFCFCNVIIAILFLASSKSSNIDRDQNQDTPSAPAKDTSVANDVAKWHHRDSTTGEESAPVGEEVMEEASASVDVAIECEDDEEKSDGYEEEVEAEDDDELRRRVEEFIAKVTRGWKAELHHN